MEKQLIRMNLKQLKKSRITRIIASIFIALSGSIILSDKLLSTFNIVLDHHYGFSDSSTFVWAVTQSIAPLILITATIFKPYLIAYSIPFYIFTIQLIWVFSPEYKLDNPLLHLYAIGSAIIFTICAFLITSRINKTIEAEKYETSFLESMLDLSVKINKRERNEI